MNVVSQRSPLEEHGRHAECCNDCGILPLGKNPDDDYRTPEPIITICSCCGGEAHASPFGENENEKIANSWCPTCYPLEGDGCDKKLHTFKLKVVRP